MATPAPVEKRDCGCIVLRHFHARPGYCCLEIPSGRIPDHARMLPYREVGIELDRCPTHRGASHG